MLSASGMGGDVADGGREFHEFICHHGVDAAFLRREHEALHECACVVDSPGGRRLRDVEVDDGRRIGSDFLIRTV